MIWNVVFGLALAALLASTGLLAFLFSAGGMAKVTAWYLFQLVPPVLGMVTLLLVIKFILCALLSASPIRGSFA